MLSFSEANTKLQKLSKNASVAGWLTGKRKVYSLDLLSGHTCPAAKECKSQVNYDWNLDKYQLVDGPDTEFRCFSASQEAVYNGPYNTRLGNWEAVAGKSAPQIAELILTSLPDKAGIVRPHVAGDFFNQQYFRAWQIVAKARPDTLFYAYTKMVHFMLRAEALDNFVLTASRGGKYDHLIDQHGLREARVVYSELEAQELGLEIDNDDSHAADPSRRDQSFALIVHGQGPKNSRQAKIFYAQRRKNT
jgi:hypothetical protein